ncbi:MAG: LamG-like jellyroll fold domain-containing protein [Bacteroidota bacterium]
MRNFILTTVIVLCVLNINLFAQTPVACYPFNGNANDESGNGYNGTVYGATLTEDRFGNTDAAYSFDGTDDYIDLNTSLLVANESTTISAWINFDEIDIENQLFYQSCPDDPDVTIQFRFNDTGFQILFGSNPAWLVPYDFTTGEWYHVIMEWENYNTVTLYVNGMPVDFHIFTNPLSSIAGNYIYNSIIGRGKGTGGCSYDYLQVFDGTIDDVSIYNYALNPAIIDSIYHFGGWDLDTCYGFYISVNTTEASCGSENGFAEVYVYEGTPPYTYNWSNSDTLNFADSLSAGMHSVQVSDLLGCYAFEQFVIEDTDGHIVTNNTVTHVTCNGDNDGAISIDVSGIGSALYDYLWSNGATTQDISNLPSGNYQVMITDLQNCITFWETTVNESAPLNVSIFATSQPNCSNSDGTIMVSVSGGASPYYYYWNTGSTGSQLTNTGAGLYSITVTDTNGCTEIAETALTSIGAPVILVDSIVSASCGSANGGIYLTITGGTTPYASYAWTDSSSSEDLTGVYPGDYALTVMDAAGCPAVFSAEVPSFYPEIQPICVVTVDTLNQTNLIVWEKVQSSGISHYNIYRESWYFGQYNLVASVPYDDMSEYNDTYADPRLRSWRYKISSVDNCGNESPLSDPHKTIHLSTDVSLGMIFDLSWDHYEGFQYSTINVYRHTNASGWVLVTSLPASQTSYTDDPPNLLGLRYMVGVNTPGQCVPTSSAKANGGPYSQSTSNMEDEGIVISISKIEGENIKIYPNPNNGEFTVEFQNFNKLTVISGFDITGNQVFKKVTSNFKTNIDIHGLAKGIYIFKIASDNQISNFRVIVQ